MQKASQLRRVDRRIIVMVQRDWKKPRKKVEKQEPITLKTKTT